MVSEMLAERRKTASDSSETANILSMVGKQDKRTIESEERYAKEKKSTIDRMRRKTTDNVVSNLSTGSNKGQPELTSRILRRIKFLLIFTI